MLPRAVLLLDDEDFRRWYADDLLDIELPRWWAQEPNGQGPALRFASRNGTKGLLHSLPHHVGGQGQRVAGAGTGAVGAGGEVPAPARELLEGSSARGTAHPWRKRL